MPRAKRGRKAGDRVRVVTVEKHSGGGAGRRCDRARRAITMAATAAAAATVGCRYFPGRVGGAAVTVVAAVPAQFVRAAALAAASPL